MSITNHNKINVNGRALSFHFMFLNFNENIGTSAISIIERNTQKTSIVIGFDTIGVIILLTFMILGKSG